MKSTEEVALNRYLCGMSTEEEKSSLEERFFLEDGFFDRLLEAEDDLVDACARGQLPTAFRADFEKRVAESRNLQERVEIARALSGLPVKRPGIQPLPLAVAAAVVLLVVAGWALLQIRALKHGSAELEAERGLLRGEITRLQEAARRADALREIPREAGPPGPVVAFALVAGLRSGGGNRIVLSSATETIVLAVPTASIGAGSSRVTIETPEGRRVADLEGLPSPSAPAKALRIALAAPLLSDGDYVLSVRRLPARPGPPDAEYAFRIVRK